MKKLILILTILLFSLSTSAQKHFTRSGKISFFSATPIENIEAFNNEVGAAIDLNSGEVVFQVPIKSFKFEKQLMQEHFNAEYMESDKFPKATFKGKIDPNDIGSKATSYKTHVKGTLTIHGVSKEVNIPGTITIKKTDEIILNAVFYAATADYNIRISSIVKGKIADKIEVTINCILKKQ
ncbi:MAG TPA: YceI family protein [Edaphocola sp.]|nr:YceI family protein [Edaphocola sp.]